MKSSKIIALFRIFSLLLLVAVISVKAVPDGESTTESAATNSSSAKRSSDMEEDIVTPEDAEIDEELAKLSEKVCQILVGDCWVYYNKTKSYLHEDQRLKICRNKIKGFKICESMTDSQVEQGKVDGEQRHTARQEAEIQEQQKMSEREAKLANRKEGLLARMMLMKESAQESNKTTSTTEVSEMQSENIQEGLETTTISSEVLETTTISSEGNVEAK